MSKETLEALQAHVDGAADLDAALLKDAADRLREVFPGAPSHPELLSEPTEAVLRLIDHCLPGWTITLRGTATEPDGHWHCSLRESGSRDNDEVIGNGNAPTVSLSLLRALVSAARARA
jgi:hypothetical protein